MASPITNRRRKTGMARDIITTQDIQEAKLRRSAAGSVAGGAPPIPVEDQYGDRLIKYIPSEIVGLYVALDSLLKTASDQIPQEIFAWLVFGFLFIMTPIYLWRVQNVKKYQTLTIATISFLVWVFTLGGPFTQISWYSPFYGALLLPIYTFSIATFKSEK
jgi:hypothetical protein